MTASPRRTRPTNPNAITTAMPTGGLPTTTPSPVFATAPSSPPSTRGRILRVALVGLVALLGAFGVVAQPAQAQTGSEERADEILAEALGRYQASLEGLEAIEMEVVQMGMPTEMRMEVVPAEAGGLRLSPVSVSVMGNRIDASQADFPGGAGIFETPLEDLTGMYRYEGEVEVDGRPAHHLSFTDPDPSGMADELMNEEGIEFLDGRGAMYLDRETFDLLRMEWEGEVLHDGEPESMMMRFESEGFDEVDGYRYPSMTRIETDAARFTMTDADREMLGEQIAQIRAGLPEGAVPEGEMGEMVRALLSQADQLTRMLEDGVMRMELEMANVRVYR